MGLPFMLAAEKEKASSRLRWATTVATRRVPKKFVFIPKNAITLSDSLRNCSVVLTNPSPYTISDRRPSAKRDGRADRREMASGVDGIGSSTFRTDFTLIRAGTTKSQLASTYSLSLSLLRSPLSQSASLGMIKSPGRERTLPPPRSLAPSLRRRTVSDDRRRSADGDH